MPASRFGFLADRMMTKLVVDEEAFGAEAHSDAKAWTDKADAILKAAAKRNPDNAFYVSNH